MCLFIYCVRCVLQIQFSTSCVPGPQEGGRRPVSRQRERVVNRKTAKSTVNAFKEASRLQCKRMTPREGMWLRWGRRKLPRRQCLCFPPHELLVETQFRMCIQVQKLCRAGGREMFLQGQGMQSAATEKLGHEEARARPSGRRQEVSVQRLRSQVTWGQEERSRDGFSFEKSQ